MAEDGADFITILSSDMIADIVQVYFDKELYTKKKVKIVDLKPQGDGYAFSLSFVQVVVKQQPPCDVPYNPLDATSEYKPTVELPRLKPKIDLDYRNGSGNDRDNKGRFVKHETNN